MIFLKKKDRLSDFLKKKKKKKIGIENYSCSLPSYLEENMLWLKSFTISCSFMTAILLMWLQLISL